MANDPAFLFYPGDYLRDTQCLSEKTQVSYDRIMCEHMRNICISHAQLKFFTKRLSDDEKDELLSVLTEKPEGFFITWVVESIEKRRSYSDSRRNNRKGSVKKEPKKHNNISSSYDSHMENEIENVNKDEIYNEIDAEKKTELIDALVLEFGFSEHKFSQQRSIIMSFVTNLEFTDMFSHFIEQFKNYKLYKTASKEKVHSFESLIGTPAMRFDNAAWNKENWANKLSVFKSDPSNQSKFERLKNAYDAPNPYLNNNGN